MRRRLIPDVVHDQKLVTVPASASLREVARLMVERKIGCVLIVNNGDRLEGIFTERDMVFRVVALSLDPDTTPVGTVMTARPETARPDDTPLDALRRLHDAGFRHLPIVDDGRLVGILSRRDFDVIELTRLAEEKGYWERL